MTIKRSLFLTYLLFFLMIGTTGCSSSDKRWAPEVDFSQDKQFITAGEPLELSFSVKSKHTTTSLPIIGVLLSRDYFIITPTGENISLGSYTTVQVTPLGKEHTVGSRIVFPTSAGSYTFVAREEIVVSPLESKTFETRKTLNISYDNNIDISDLATTDAGLSTCFTNHSGVTVAEITQLNCSNYAIEDISAIIHLMNLRELSLDVTLVSDITPILRLPNLNNVDVSVGQGNCTSQFDLYDVFENTGVNLVINSLDCPLSQRVALVDITFDDPKFSQCVRDNTFDATYAHQLKHLKCTKFADFNGMFIDGIEQLIGLRTLSVRRENETGSSTLDLSLLEGLIHLHDVHFQGAVSNVASLGKLRLNRLALTSNINQTDFDNITANLIDPSRLQVIDLFNNDLTDISALSRFTNLEQLTITRNKLSDLTPLINLRKMTQLDVSDNLIADVPNLLMPKLEVLDISDNPVSTFAEQHLSTQLTKLHIDNGQLVDISNIGKLPTSVLSELSLANNNISDIAPLETIILNNDLLSIILNNNSISDLDVFSQPSFNFIYFDFEDNQIEAGVENICRLYRASYFGLAGNNQIPCEELAFVPIQKLTSSPVECVASNQQ